MTRRQALQAGLALSAAALATPLSSDAATFAVPAGPALPAPAALPRRREQLDLGWRFHLGDADDAAADFGLGRNQETFAKTTGAVRAARANFDDRAWSEIELPHDWAVDLPFVEDPALVAHGSKPLGRKYPATSIGWYRRVFQLPGEDAGQRLRLDFDGVFRHAMVFFNNAFLGESFSGYAPFGFDLTDLANPGAENVLVVRADATLGEGWFYEGAGLYRHVWLTRTPPLHFEPDGVAVRSEVRSRRALVTVAAEVTNAGDAAASVRLAVSVGGIRARSAQTEVAPWSTTELTAVAAIANPDLWSLERPHLYQAECGLEGAGGGDAISIPFGIRGLRFDADQGFFLNNERVELQGTCNHQDHAGVGAALPDRLQSYRIERLQAMGCNAYRTSHNPPTPELLDACDRLGMLVLDETRMMASTPEGLSQLERLIRRDRNHPSVVMWSLGNEEPLQGTEAGGRILASMKRLAKKLDPTRPVTLAMNGGWGRGASLVVDVQGFNYGNGGGSAQTAPHIDDFHRRFPRQPCFGSETASAVSTRGIYANDKERGYVSAYDVNFPGYALNAEGWWKIFAVRKFLAGGFAWTGFDYRGEPSPYGWPCISSHFGILDTCGFPKDSFYYYQSWWTAKPVLHLFPHWNWAGSEGQPIEVWCHTNLEEVELLLNGRSLGSRRVEPQGHAAWTVPYAAGVLSARGRSKSGVEVTSTRVTTGPPAALALRPDRTGLRADGEDLSVVAVEVRDAAGHLVPTASNLVRFTLDGPGRILGVGNGDPSSHEPDHASQRSAFNGLCMVLVQSRRSAGTVVLEATADGIASARIQIATTLAARAGAAGAR
ncbi:MAG TPA: beta-galactosidase GalA [Terriglobales bacterium]|nr:beta-galactosidase GalA [Terriglobales bacterium]